MHTKNPAIWEKFSDTQPTLGVPVIICTNGTVQHDTYQLEQADPGDPSSQLFWNREDLDEYVNTKPSDLWCYLPDRTTDIGINTIARLQNQWVQSVGWHNKSTLESLALVASEVAEAINECRFEKPTEQLGEELADIILRTADLAETLGIDLAHEISQKMDKNQRRGTRGRSK